MSEELKKYRQQIDRIDNELLKLFNQRASLAQQIGHAKGGSAVLRPDREAQVLQRMKEANQGPLSPDSVAQLFTETMSQCRALEKLLSVAYLGPEGTFSEEAVLKRFGTATENIPCASIDEVFRLVANGSAEYGLVPVENSTEGMIGRTLDLLDDNYDQLKICGEVLLPIHLCLMAKKVNGRFRAAKAVLGHPQALAQSQGWLNANLRKVPRMPTSSNALGAKLAADDPTKYAVAGKRAAIRFELDIKVENIEDDARNTTRFLVIGKQDVAASGKDKTSLVMAAENRPGAVHDLLTPLAQNGVSMTKLESRPSRTGLWEYVFYVDIEGHQSDAKVAAALAQLKQIAAFVKVLGSYPVAV